MFVIMYNSIDFCIQLHTYSSTKSAKNAEHFWRKYKICTSTSGFFIWTYCRACRDFTYNSYQDWKRWWRYCYWLLFPGTCRAWFG